MPFIVNNVVIKNPTTFKVERYNVTTMERLANADMVGDLVAKKYKFYFTYEAIMAHELDAILNAIWESNSIFYPFECPYQGRVITASVYSGSIPSELHYAGRASNWTWKNVMFNLIQR